MKVEKQNIDNNMENQTEDIEVMQHVTPDVIYQQDKAFIDIQVSTAKAFPRKVKRATDNAIAIVTLDMATAQSCTYSVPRAGKAITGPSVHLANILAQAWKNLRIESKVVDIDQTHVTSEAVCFDLESNYAVKFQVKRSIVGKTGRFSDDMITVTGNAANAIARRNAIFAIIPKPVLNKVYEAAKAAITGDTSDINKLVARRKQVFDRLQESLEVTEKEILGAIGKQALDYVTADDLVILIGIGTAIRDGDTTIEQAFKKEPAAALTLEDLQKLYDEKLPLLSKTEMESAKRIIENKEKDSYKKLHTLLTSKA